MSSQETSKFKTLSELALELNNVSLDGHITNETIEAIREQDDNVFTELKRTNEKVLQYKLTQDSYHKSAEDNADDGNIVSSNSIDKQESLEEKDTKNLDEQAKIGGINQESLEENELKKEERQLEESKVNQNLDTTSLQEQEQTSESQLKALKTTKFTLSVQSYEQDDIITVQNDVLEVQQQEDFVDLDTQLEETQEKITADLLGLANETMEKAKSGNSLQIMDVHEVPEWISNPEINVENLDVDPLVQSNLSKISLHLQSVRNEISSSSSGLSSKKTTTSSISEENEENKFTREELEEMYREEMRKQSELVKQNTQVQHHLCKILRLHFYKLFIFFTLFCKD